MLALTATCAAALGSPTHLQTKFLKILTEIFAREAFENGLQLLVNKAPFQHCQFDVENYYKQYHLSIKKLVPSELVNTKIFS